MVLTDELAGKVLEQWMEKFPDVEMSGKAYHELRQIVLAGIRGAVEQDRQERLDYEKEDRLKSRRANGFMDMWGFHTNL